MLLTVQPEVISGIMRNSQMRGRGLCARFLYSWCDSMLGRREINPPPVDNELREHYISRVEQALSGEQTGVLPGDAGYHELRLNYQELVEHDLVGPELGGFTGLGRQARRRGLPHSGPDTLLVPPARRSRLPDWARELCQGVGAGRFLRRQPPAGRTICWDTT